MPGEVDADTIRNDFDAFWKEALDGFLPEFLALVVPQLHRAIDWSHPYESLESEFQALFPTTDRAGRLFVDRLYRVTLSDGSTARLLLHVEVQVGPDAGIARRVLVYRVHIANRLGGPVYNLLILADDDPDFRPDAFEERVLDQTHRLDIPVVKLLDFKDRVGELEGDENPFALLLVAWFGTRDSRPDRRRLEFKKHLLELLREKGYDRERINEVLTLIDWIVRLPRSLQIEFRRHAELLDGESDMPIVPPLGELYREEGLKEGLSRGREQGLEKGLETQRETIVRIVHARFGPPPPPLPRRLMAITDPQTLVELATLAATVEHLDGFLAALPS